MRQVNEHKLINVRVSKETFEHIKTHAPFVETNIPGLFRPIESLTKGETAICFTHNIDAMIQHIDQRAEMLTPKTMPLLKQMLDVKAELSELHKAMHEGKFAAAYIMAER